MNCSNCIEAKPIPICTGSLIIGTVDVSEEVYVFIENVATGYISMQSITPDQYDRTIGIDMTNPYPDFYSPNFYFKIWVSETEDGNTPVNFTIDNIEYECLTILFHKLYSDDQINSLTETTIKI